jgi:dihydroorotate dehydrogenase (NAD+) catalytic subunit
MGGIASGRNAAEFLAAGAACVAVGTESFRDPAAGRRIAGELASLQEGAREDPTRLRAGDGPFRGQRAVFLP